MALQKKRTYSKHDKRGAALAQDFHRKRPKGAEDDDKLRLPTDPPRRSQASFSSFTMKQKFNGPVSFTDMVDDMDIDSVPNRRNALDVFDKVQASKGKPDSVKRQQPNIYGSREDFESTMKDSSREKKTNGGASSRYLPTPPSDNEQRQKKNFGTIVPNLNGRGSNVIPKPKPSVPRFESTNTSKLFENIITKEELRVPYVPKQYTSGECPAPRRDICGNRLSSSSDKAMLWSGNQAKSPFLRLPGEVRNLIYEHMFGRKTIKIDYETYRTTKHRHKPNKVEKVFKYHCTVHSRLRNPFKDTHPSWVEISTGLTLLNSVCRQLYLETSCLPFTANYIAFGSHNVMVNFILHEKRLTSQQRRAISVLMLPDSVPASNILTYLPNVEKVLLACNQYHEPQGQYTVIRKDGEKPRLQNPYGVMVRDL